MTDPNANADALPGAVPPRAEHWRCTVRNLGPIDQAEVEVRPVTLFVGENNSGKTWLATVLWALHSDQFPTCFEVDGDADWQSAAAAMATAFRTVRPALGLDDSQPAQPTQPATVPANVAAGAVAGDWPRWAAQLRERAVSRLVTAYLPGIRDSVAIDMPVREAPVGWSAQTWNPGGAPGPALALVRVGLGHDVFSRLGRGLTPNNDKALLQFSAGAAGDILALTAGAPVPQRAFLSGAGYLPASRTGLMQLLPMVAQESARALGRIDPLRHGEGAAPEDGGALAVPGVPPAAGWLVERLMSNFVFAKQFEDLAQLLGDQVLRGQVQAHPNRPSDFRFIPLGTSIEIPMGSASSVVTEVYPFVHLLRTGNIPAFLVVEEPEAHLHPRIQRKLARVLVRLANRGVKLLISTHSDIFAQQINNCLKLGAAKAKLSAERYGNLLTAVNADAEEALVPDDVAAYGFVRIPETGRTRVDRLTVHPEGVAMPSFNEELQDLNREMDLLDAALEGA